MTKKPMKWILMFVAVALLAIMTLVWVHRNTLLLKLRRNHLITLHMIGNHKQFFEEFERYFPSTQDPELLTRALDIYLRRKDLENSVLILWRFRAQDIGMENSFTLAALYHVLGDIQAASKEMKVLRGNKEAETELEKIMVMIGKEYHNVMAGEELNALEELLYLNNKVEELDLRMHWLHQAFLDNLIGLAFFKTCYFQEASQYLEKSLTSSMNLPSSLLYLAAARVALDDMEMGRYYYHLWCKAKSDVIGCELPLSDILGECPQRLKRSLNLAMLTDDLAGALDCISALDGRSSSSIGILYKKGLCYEELGEKDKALSLYDQVISIGSADWKSQGSSEPNVDEFIIRAQFRSNLLRKKDFFDGLSGQLNKVFLPMPDNPNKRLAFLWGDGQSYDFEIMPEGDLARIGIVCSATTKSGIGALMAFGLKQREDQMAYVWDTRPQLKMFTLKVMKNRTHRFRIIFKNDVIRYIDNVANKEDRNLYIYAMALFK